jgi:hypothetical protein
MDPPTTDHFDEPRRSDNRCCPCATDRSLLGWQLVLAQLLLFIFLRRKRESKVQRVKIRGGTYGTDLSHDAAPNMRQIFLIP